MTRSSIALRPVRALNAAMLVMLLLLTGCPLFRSARPSGGKPLPPDVQLKLQAALEEAAAYTQAPGMVMAVQIGDSEPWIRAIGCQDAGCTLEMTPEATFRAGSITKNFVGTAILQQASEGKLNLDDTLERWLPGVFSNIDGNGITIRQMMSHTSGIESYTDSLDWVLTVYGNPLYVWNAPQELLRYAEQLRAQSLAANSVSPPGSAFRYSNTNAILLGMIAAKADGYEVTEWQRVLQERFFDRLGLMRTRAPAARDTALGSSNRGYINYYNFFGGENCGLVTPPCTDRDVDITELETSNAWSAGALVSSAGDLLRWLNAEVKGDLLGPEIRQQQQDFMATGNANLQVGLSMFRQAKYGFIGHRGEIFGFNATMQYLPEKDLTVVVLANRSALSGRHVGPVPERVAEALFPELLSQQRMQLRAGERPMESEDPPHFRNPYELAPQSSLQPLPRQKPRAEEKLVETEDPPHFRNPFELASRASLELKALQRKTESQDPPHFRHSFQPQP